MYEDVAYGNRICREQIERPQQEPRGGMMGDRWVGRSVALALCLFAPASTSGALDPDRQLLDFTPSLGYRLLSSSRRRCCLDDYCDKVYALCTPTGSAGKAPLLPRHRQAGGGFRERANRCEVDAPCAGLPLMLRWPPLAWEKKVNYYKREHLICVRPPSH